MTTRRWTVGLDVGGTKAHAVLLDDGVPHASVRVTTGRRLEGVVAAALEAIDDLCAPAGLTAADLAGVGIGVPGIVDPAAGTVSHAVNLGIDAAAVPLGAVLSERLGGVPVAVENDLTVATLGAAEVLRVDDVALLAMGTGMAAGLVLGGKVRRGFRGGAGEVGHLLFRPDGPRCACGQRGCLELYGSGSALDAAWTSRSGRPAPVEVFEAATAGDPEAVAVLDVFVDAVATAVRVIALTVDVEYIVLGGGVAGVGAPMLAAVSEALSRQAVTSPFLAHMAIPERLRLTPTGVPVAPIGAARAAADRFERESSWRS